MIITSSSSNSNSESFPYHLVKIVNVMRCNLFLLLLLMHLRMLWRKRRERRHVICLLLLPVALLSSLLFRYCCLFRCCLSLAALGDVNFRWFWIFFKSRMFPQRIVSSFYQEDDGHTTRLLRVSCASSYLLDHQERRRNRSHSLHSTLHKTCNLVG